MIELLPAIIATFCQLNNPTIPKDNRIDCLEAFTNCAIIKDGQTSEKQIEKCKTKIQLKYE